MHQLVPEFILRKLSLGELGGEFQAAALFVDITGFSTMTETLMQHGQHGSEVLADLMCSVFDPMITTVYSYGGFVSTLAGDAIAAIFPSNSKIEMSVRQALATAWEIRESARDRHITTEEYGNFEISARIGLALGSIEWGIITSENRSTYFFRGSAIEGCSQAEQRAASGQIIVGEKAFEYLQDQVEGSLDQGFYTVTGLNGMLPEKQDIVEPDTLDQNLTAFFPNSLVTQPHSGEFRQVVNLFIQLPTVRNKTQLQIFMRSLFRLQRKYGGLLNRLDFGDKGAHLLLFWGAPRTYENDIERALNPGTARGNQHPHPCRHNLQYFTRGFHWKRTQGRIYLLRQGGKSVCALYANRAARQHLD
jgi:class 3 adenylate cyclase